jgi:hypothetical protein
MALQSQESPRRQLDAQKSVTLALPIISATANTNIIDLEVVKPFASLDQVNFVAFTDAATANNGNAAAINCIMQHSAEPANTANMVNVPGQALTSIASNGATYPATNIVFAVPPTALLRYVRLQIAQGAGGSNAANTANVTFALAF